MACYYGLGTPDDELNDRIITTGKEYMTWWDACYLISLSLVKTSIAIAVVRIAPGLRHRYYIYVCITLSNVTFMGALVWLLASCQPLAARWDSSLGTCAATELMAPLSYAATVIAVVTDAGCAIIPVMIVRKLEMTSRVKYALMVVLAMGSLASVASLARFAFVPYYNETYNYLCKFSLQGWLSFLSAATDTIMRFLDNNMWIVLLSLLEVNIGIIASSLPGLGKLFKILRSKESNASGPIGAGATHTIGGTPLSYDTQLGDLTPQGRGESSAHIRSDRGWTRIRDDGYSRKSILQKTVVSVSHESRSDHTDWKGRQP